MKAPKLFVAILAISLMVTGIVETALSQSAATEKTFAEMKEMLGTVPSFIKAYPEPAIPSAWEQMKAVQLNPDTAVPPKYKELIGLAVAAQIPCEYCIYFHTEAAKMGGADAEEIKEALAIAALTRHWSTVLNGNQIDPVAFRKEAKAIFEFAGKAAETKTAASPAPVTDAASAYADIERTLGSVPTFMRRFPEAGIAGAWKTMKTIQLNPNTAIPTKYKELIGLGVAAQVPCNYCTYFHTEAAKMDGATDQQVSETIAMAALVRHWSTVLNGSQIDSKTFRAETDKIIKHVTAGMQHTAAE